MEENRNEENIRNYIERMTVLQNKQRDALSLEDMQSVARELGMSDEDLAAADTAAKSYLQRGLGHTQHGNWDDAVGELKNAVALNPMNVEALHGLALAHKERWATKGTIEDYTQAERFARQALELSPDHSPSFKLLGDLKKGGGSLTSPTPTAYKSRMIFGIGLLVAIAIAIILLIVMARSGATP